jgi:hypothetical protein
MRVILSINENKNFDTLTFDKKMSEIIDDIHNEFTSISDNLLNDLENSLKSFDKEKLNEKLLVAEELNNLGFNKSKTVTNVLKDVKINKINNYLYNTLLYYKSKYLYKFIDYENVYKLCKKYKLILAPVNRFIGEIPEKNQKEILNFKFDIKDYDTTKESNYVNGVNLLIVATPDLIDKTGMRIQGIELVKDDPIVLQQVNGGYLIVTAWGNEANDEIIINEKMN